MKTVYLVSCVSKKSSGPSAAKDLYTSDWFLKARSYVEKRDGAWFILSAKYGLLDPDQKIEPYEVTLNNMSVSARRDWAQNVLKALETLIGPEDRLVILAGARYREFLTERLESLCAEVVVPMEGLRIGEQLAWLNSQGACDE